MKKVNQLETEKRYHGVITQQGENIVAKEAKMNPDKSFYMRDEISPAKRREPPLLPEPVEGQGGVTRMSGPPGGSRGTVPINVPFAFFYQELLIGIIMPATVTR